MRNLYIPSEEERQEHRALRAKQLVDRKESNREKFERYLANAPDQRVVEASREEITTEFVRGNSRGLILQAVEYLPNRIHLRWLSKEKEKVSVKTATGRRTVMKHVTVERPKTAEDTVSKLVDLGDSAASRVGYDPLASDLETPMDRIRKSRGKRVGKRGGTLHKQILEF